MRALRFGLFALAAIMASSTAAEDLAPQDRRSGFSFMQPQTQAMQSDDTANPGMLWVSEGERLWNEAPATGPACAACHAAAKTSMRGVAARYPAYDAATNRPVDLETRINACRTRHQNAAVLGYDSDEMLALAAYIGFQSRGVPIELSKDPRLDAVRAEGRALFHARMGQLDLSCSLCHDERWGKKLAGAPLPQGTATGYPLYRLEWQTLGSLQRRLRNCMMGMRMEPYPPGSPETIALEAYLAERSQGLPMETPAVRP